MIKTLCKRNPPHRKWGSRITYTLAVATTLIGAILIMPAVAQVIEGCQPTKKPKILEKRERELRETGVQLLEAFRTGNTEKFLTLVHKKYFGRGTGDNGGDYTLSELKEIFHTRGALYCYLFDSNCIPPRTEDLPVKVRDFSFSELAKWPGARVKFVDLWITSSISGCRGQVALGWPEMPKEDMGIDSTLFTFMYENGQWKPTGFDDPASAVIKEKH